MCSLKVFKSGKVWILLYVPLPWAIEDFSAGNQDYKYKANTIGN